MSSARTPRRLRWPHWGEMIVQVLFLGLIYLIAADLAEAISFDDCANADNERVWPRWCYEGPVADDWFNHAKTRYLARGFGFLGLFLFLISLPFWVRRLDRSLALSNATPLVAVVIMKLFFYSPS